MVPSAPEVNLAMISLRIFAFTCAKGTLHFIACALIGAELLIVCDGDIWIPT